MKRRDLLRALACAPWLAPLAAIARLDGAADATIAARFGTLPEPRHVRRVYAAGPPAGVLVHALAPDKLLGWPQQLSAEARAWLAPAARDLPFIGRLAGRGSTMPIEALLQLQPDFVLDAGVADATSISTARRVAEQTGLPYVLTEGRLADHPAQLRAIGRLLGVEARAAQLAAWAEATLDAAAHIRDATPLERRPRVYYGRGTGGLETGLEGAIHMEVIEFCGARNVAAAAGRGGLAQVSPEQILAWDPEVILTQDPDFARRVRTDPLWRPVDAVRHGRVHCAPSLPFGWLDVPPGVNRLLGVRWLLAKLYPEQAAALMPAGVHADAADYYRLFHGIEPEAGALERLLDEPA